MSKGGGSISFDSSGSGGSSHSYSSFSSYSPSYSSHSNHDSASYTRGGCCGSAFICFYGFIIILVYFFFAWMIFLFYVGWVYYRTNKKFVKKLQRRETKGLASEFVEREMPCSYVLMNSLPLTGKTALQFFHCLEALTHCWRRKPSCLRGLTITIWTENDSLK